MLFKKIKFAALAAPSSVAGQGRKSLMAEPPSLARLNLAVRAAAPTGVSREEQALYRAWELAFKGAITERQWTLLSRKLVPILEGLKHGDVGQQDAFLGAVAKLRQLWKLTPVRHRGNVGRMLREIDFFPIASNLLLPHRSMEVRLAALDLFCDMNLYPEEEVLHEMTWMTMAAPSMAANLAYLLQALASADAEGISYQEEKLRLIKLVAWFMEFTYAEYDHAVTHVINYQTPHGPGPHPPNPYPAYASQPWNSMPGMFDQYSSSREPRHTFANAFTAAGGIEAIDALIRWADRPGSSSALFVYDDDKDVYEDEDNLQFRCIYLIHEFEAFPNAARIVLKLDIPSKLLTFCLRGPRFAHAAQVALNHVRHMTAAWDPHDPNQNHAFVRNHVLALLEQWYPHLITVYLDLHETVENYPNGLYNDPGNFIRDYLFFFHTTLKHKPLAKIAAANRRFVEHIRICKQKMTGFSSQATKMLENMGV